MSNYFGAISEPEIFVTLLILSLYRDTVSSIPISVMIECPTPVALYETNKERVFRYMEQREQNTNTEEQLHTAIAEPLDSVLILPHAL